MKKIIFIVFIFPLIMLGQNAYSLKLALKSVKHDTTRCNVLKLLATYSPNEEQEGYTDELNRLVEKNLTLNPAQPIKNIYKKHLSFVMRKKGLFYSSHSDYPKALEYYFKGLEISEEIGDRLQAGRTFGNIANVYTAQADYPKALEYNFKALKLSEEKGDKKTVGKTLGSIANVYINQADYTKALEYYIRGLKISEEIGDKQQVGIALGNIANVYIGHADYPKALEYNFKALKLNEEEGNGKTAAGILGNIANVYIGQADYPRALEYYLKGLKLSEEVGDKSTMGILLGNLGCLSASIVKYKEAELYFKRALLISKEIGAEDLEKSQNEYLSNLYSKTNRPALALEHYKKFIALRDSIFSKENMKKLMHAEMDREYEKKTQEQKFEQEKKDIQANEEKQKQKIITYSISVGLVLVLLLALFILRGYRQKQKDNQIITRQKHEVEESKKEIIDSIHYAKRIQRAMIPSDKYIEKNLSRLRNKG